MGVKQQILLAFLLASPLVAQQPLDERLGVNIRCAEQGEALSDMDNIPALGCAWVRGCFRQLFRMGRTTTRCIPCREVSGDPERAVESTRQYI
jgi:hypothetical protein